MNISDTYLKRKFAPFEELMHNRDVPEIVIRTFRQFYAQLLEGRKGLIPESEILPIDSIADAETIPDGLEQEGRAALPKTVFLKLNGGLGTSMGLNQAKSSLIARDNYSFLEIIARHSLHENLLLILMNSFATHKNSEYLFDKYPDLRKDHRDIPLDFLQHKVPKVNRNDLTPASWTKNPAFEWCPPGHGDIYTALLTSGILDRLLEDGFEYAFISNADNLGAVADCRILGYFAANRIPFMIEAADRTESDRKGGHIARLPDGQLLLREVAQCPPEDLQSFQDISRHRYFNTNNIWIHLPSLKKVLLENDNILGLSLIRNAKTIDPRDKHSTPVYQLETAMGSAISVFENSRVIRVPRSRFIPVKNTTDLLALRSNAYCLTDDFRIVLNPERKLNSLHIDLDPGYYRMIDDLERHFPEGTPSLVDCDTLKITGNVAFGKDITLRGRVSIVNNTDRMQTVSSGSVIEGVHTFS